MIRPGETPGLIIFNDYALSDCMSERTAAISDIPRLTFPPAFTIRINRRTASNSGEKLAKPAKPAYVTRYRQQDA